MKIRKWRIMKNQFSIIGIRHEDPHEIFSERPHQIGHMRGGGKAPG